MSIRLDVPCLVRRIHLIGFVVAKHIDAKIVQLFQLLDFTKWCRERDSSDVDLGFIATVATQLSTVIFCCSDGSERECTTQCTFDRRCEC